MIHFSQVKDLTLSVFRDNTDESCKFYLLRDVFGRISVYIEGDCKLDSLKEKCIQAVGQEWLHVFASISNQDILYDDVVKAVEQVENNVFYGERPLVKKAWKGVRKSELDITSKVVTFYSYKGGLGRTTALVMTALQLVRQGKKVVVVDLDLEAPGVATLLRPENNEYPQYGVVDFFLESTKYPKHIDIDEYIYPITSKKLTGLSGGELLVMQAVNTSQQDCDHYFDKLSRIDFGMPQFTHEGSPVDLLLQEIDRRYKPDYIFLDSRAGIHDIGGLALNRYTDMACLVFYGNEQNMFGLQFVLPKLVEQEISFCLINSLVPLSEEEAEEERYIFIQTAYEILTNCGYYDETYTPDLYDESADHFPLDIKYNPEATMITSESRMDILLRNEGTNNLYLKIADTLTIQPRALQNPLVDIDRQAVLSAIESIIPGETAAAETEFTNADDLRRRFYPLKEHKYIFDNNKFLIVGPKGSGKTALFSVLQHPEYAKELAKYLHIPMHDINKTEWITGLGLGSEFPSQDNFDAVGQENDIKTYRIYWQCLAVRVLQKFTREYQMELPSAIEELLHCKFSEIKNRLKGTEHLAEMIADFLGQIDRELASRNKVLILTYDALDFLLHRQYRGHMIAALIGLWFENITRFQNLKAKIFLREDIFKFEVKEGITDKVKLKNYTSNLGWEYNFLLAMVWKRIVENDQGAAKVTKEVLSSQGYDLPEFFPSIGYVPVPGEEANKLLLRYFIGEKMGKGNKAYTYNWIWYRLGDTNKNIVPRSILKLFSLTAKHENDDPVKLIHNMEPILRPKALVNSLKEVSEDRLSDLAEEYPEYKLIFENLKNYCASFPANEEVLREALQKCGIEEDRVKTVIDELKEIGMLKEYQRKKSDPVRYHIPDIYLKGMGLSRKGYQ